MRREGSSYVAQSPTKTYTGALKAVVENAVSDLKAAGGGTVTFQAGDFDIGSDYFRLENVSDIIFEGQGIDVTFIRNFTNVSADTEPFNFSGATRITIRDMTVSAGGAARTTSDTLDFDRGNDSLVERVKITGSRGKGIIFDGKNAGWNSSGNVVRDCIITGTPNDAIQFLASTNNRVEGCTISNTAADGIEATKSSTQAPQANKKSNDNVIIGNTIDNVGENGIKINSSDRNQIVGNIITNSSDDVSGRDGIRISSSDSITCDDNVVDGNTATDNQPTKTQTYGLHIASSLCNRTSVGTNNFAGNRVGEIRDAGTNTQYGPPDTTPPNPPSNLTASAVSANRVDLSWTASSSTDVVGYEIFRNGSSLTSVGNVTTFSDSTVAPSATYSYQVRARDGAGNVSSFSNTANVTTPAAPPPDTTPPGPPTELTANAVSATRVDLSWTAATDNVGVAGYEIFRDGTSIVNIGTVTTYSDTTAIPSTTHSYQAKARDAAGNVSSFSNTATVTTPDGPAVMTFTATEDATVRADQPTTNLGSDARLETDNSPVMNFLLKFDVSGIGNRSVASAKLRLSCVDSSNHGGTYYRVLNPAAWSEGTVTWNTAPGAATTPLGSLGSVSAGTVYELDVSSLVRDRTSNLVSLRTTSTSANGADFSSTEGSVPPQLVVTTEPDTQAPTTPTGLSATAVSYDRVDLSWTASTDNVGVTGYDIFRDGSLLASIGNITNYTDTTVSPSTTYGYQVRAVDAAGNLSALSDPASVTTQPPPDTEAPSSPTGLSATAVSHDRVDLSWTASTDNVGVTGYDIFRDGVFLTTVGNVTTYSDFTVSPLTLYQYVVRARDEAGNASGFSNAATVLTGAPPPDTEAPSTPTGFSATAVSHDRVDLSWSASTDNVGVTGYDIFRDGQPLVIVGAVTTYSDTTVSPSTTYSYQVRARDGAGNVSAFSDPAQATTPEPPDTEAPTTPTGLSATAVSYDRVDLSWTASTDNVGVTGYDIFRDGSLLASIGNITNYTDTTVSPSTTYGYQVRAVDAAGNLSALSDSASVTTPPDTEAPSTPTGFSATAVSHDRVDLSWTAPTDNVGVTGYDLLRDGQPLVTLGAVTNYSDTTVSPSTTYSYQVRARDGAGNVSAFSDPAQTTTPGAPDTEPPTMPTGLSATAVSPTRVDLSWSASSDNVGVTGYEVFRNGSFLASVGAVTNYADTTASPSTTYTYRVRARDAAANFSALSAPASATTPGLPVFSDGFETGTFGAWTSNTGLVAQQQEVFAGSWAARGTTTSAATWAYRTLGTTYPELYYRIRFKVISQGSSSTVNLLKLRTATGTALFGLFRNTSGNLGIRNEVAAVSTTSTTPITTGTWHEVQVRVRINGASGEAETWFDGVRIASLSKIENFGTTPIGRLQIGENSSGKVYDVAFDEVAAGTSFISP